MNHFIHAFKCKDTDEIKYTKKKKKEDIQRTGNLLSLHLNTVFSICLHGAFYLVHVKQGFNNTSASSHIQKCNRKM